MSEISREEFVKLAQERMGVWNIVLAKDFGVAYECVTNKGFVLFDREGWKQVKTLMKIQDNLPFNNAEDNLVWLLGRFEELRKMMEG